MKPMPRRHGGTPPLLHPARPRSLAWAAALWAAWAALCAAAAAADPMRPLAAAPQPAAAAAPTDTGGTTTAAAPAAPVRRLLAIRQEHNGERAALFGDRWVRVGDSFMAPEGQTLVLAIGPTHIEWEQGRVRSTHHLLAPLLPAQWPVAPAAVHAPRDATRTGAAQVPPAGPRKNDSPAPEMPTPPHLPTPPAPSQTAAPTLMNPHRETVKP